MRWRREQPDSDASEPDASLPPEAAEDEPVPPPPTEAEPTPEVATEVRPDTAPASATPSVWADHEVSSQPVRELPDIPVDLGRVEPQELQRAIRRAATRAIAEDLGDRGDLTSIATVPAHRDGAAEFIARRGGVVAGLDVAREVFRQVDPRVTFEARAADGDLVDPGDVIATVHGSLRSILTAERTALNFLGHLSGIATQTRAYADAVAGSGAVVRDTRKTTPGLRLLDKAAVAAGGGSNHRVGLYDAILVKDNHVLAAGGVGQAAQAAMKAARGRHVQVEVTSLDQIDEVLRAGVKDVLVDNFTPDEVAQAVRRIAGRARVEASGTITLDTIRDYAEAGADRISCGALTHSAPWLDIALDVRPVAHDEVVDVRDGDDDWTLATILGDAGRPGDPDELELAGPSDLPFIDSD